MGELNNGNLANLVSCKKCGKRMSPKLVEEGNTMCLDCTTIVEKTKQYEKEFEEKSHDYEVIDGVFIKVISKDEEKYLDDVAKDYKDIDFEIPDPNSLLSILFTLRLESKRLSDQLVNLKMDITERKKIIDSIKNISVEIKTIQSELEITRAKLQSKEKSVLEVFKEQMSNAIKYFAENKGHRTGIGICDKCHDRIIFRGNFETLESELLEQIEEILQYMKEKREPDSLFLDTEKEKIEIITKIIKEKYNFSDDLIDFLIRLFYLLEVRKFPEAYVVYHKRQIEESLQ
jgi:hypothetical protein